MNRHQLADQLRARQYATQAQNEALMRKELNATDYEINLFRHQLKHVSDDQIIDSYITCSECGEKEINDESTLMYVIENSSDSDDFLQKAAAYAEHKAHYDSRKKNMYTL